MKKPLHLLCLMLIAPIASAQFSTARESYSWTYYRPTNTGIQGDWCEALMIASDGNPWIAGYDPGFEEGGIAKFIYPENRWFNLSNVDYPQIGHPEQIGVVRISDIDTDASGRMWMATGSGGLFYDPAVGPTSLRRFGADNSPIPGGWNKGVEVAPDGTVWFSSYSTYWGSGGIAKYNPATNQWQVFQDYGGGPLAVQPKPGGGYYVWTMLGTDSARFDSTTSTWTTLPKANGNPAYLIGKNLTDSSGNTWMYKWTNADLSEYALDIRRPDGTWANIAHAPFDVPFNSASALRAIAPNQAVVVDGGGEAYRFNGSGWTSLGAWFNNTSTYDVDMDADGNVWVCGAGGAARRDVGTGLWQRYRITNTSQYDFFTYDIAIDPAGGIYATANAGPGYGGLVRFDGTRWTGFNKHQYGLGYDWPFDTDNGEAVYVRPSTGELVANPMFNYLHSFNGSAWTNLNGPADAVEDVIEDSLGRLWIGTEWYLGYFDGVAWHQVPNANGTKLFVDPTRSGTIWAFGVGNITRTDAGTTTTWTMEDFPELDPQITQFSGIAVSPNGIVWIGANTTDETDSCTLIRLDPSTGNRKLYGQAIRNRFPGQTIMPLAATADGKVWMQYDSSFLVNERGLLWFDGKLTRSFPAPPGGEFRWGGLPHAAIYDLEVRPMPKGYDLWMSCASRGIAVLKYRPSK